MRLIKNKIQLKETPLPDEWDDDIKRKINIKTEPSVQTHLDIITKSLSDKEQLLQQIEDAQGKFSQQGKGTSRIAYYIQNGSQANTIIKFAHNEKGVYQNGQELKVLLSPDAQKSYNEKSCIIKLIDYDKDSDTYKETGNPLWIQLEPVNVYYEFGNRKKMSASEAEEIFKKKYHCSPDVFDSFLKVPQNRIDEYFKRVYSSEGDEWKKYYQKLYELYQGKLSEQDLKLIILFILIIGMSYELNLKIILGSGYKEDYLLQMLEDMKPLLSLYKLKQTFNLTPGDITGIHNWGYRDEDKQTPIIFDLGLSDDIYKKFYARKPY